MRDRSLAVLLPRTFARTFAAESDYDLIIAGGLVYDGTGAAPVRADVAA